MNFQESQAAGWAQRQREEEARKRQEEQEKERQRQQEEARKLQEEWDRRQKRQEEDRKRQEEDWKRQDDRKRQEEWNEHWNKHSHSSGGGDSSGFVLPWSGKTLLDKILSVPLFIVQIGALLLILMMIESVVRSLLGSDCKGEDFFTVQLWCYYIKFLQIIYEITAPIIQQLFEMVYQLFQSFLGR